MGLNCDGIHCTLSAFSTHSNTIVSADSGRESNGYLYTRHLVALDGCRPSARSPAGAVVGSQVVTPLRVQTWRHYLQQHPDKEFARYLLSGIEEGFRIGFRYADCKCRPARRNMPSAYHRPEVIEEYLAKGCAVGRVLGPFPAGAIPNLQISRFGLLEKRHQPGKWRLILDLSYPRAASVNDGIDRALCSLSYVSVDQVAAAVLELGRGTMLSKTDVKSAYRIVPIHPDDRQLLGM